MSVQPGLLVFMDAVSFRGKDEVSPQELPSFGLFSLLGDGVQLPTTRSLSTHQLPLDFIKRFVAKYCPGTSLHLMAIGYQSFGHSEELTLTPDVEQSVDLLYIIIKEALLSSQR